MHQRGYKGGPRGFFLEYSGLNVCLEQCDGRIGQNDEHLGARQPARSPASLRDVREGADYYEPQPCAVIPRVLHSDVERGSQKRCAGYLKVCGAVLLQVLPPRLARQAEPEPLCSAARVSPLEGTANVFATGCMMNSGVNALPMLKTVGRRSIMVALRVELVTSIPPIIGTLSSALGTMITGLSQTLTTIQTSLTGIQNSLIGITQSLGVIQT